MNLIVLGTNHKHSPLGLRERLSFLQKRLPDSLDFLRRMSSLGAGVILSTCNRVEIYASCEDPQRALSQIEDFICRYQEVSREKLSYFYKYTDKEALAHLVSVSCGLDSLVLGETQILTQIKGAWAYARQAGFMDNFLQRVLEEALSLAKSVHSKTRITEGKVSVPSIAIDFIKQKLGNLSDKTILIIGVGKISELVLKYLNKHNPNVVFISNRTFSRAKALAEKVNGQAIRFDELNSFLKKADVIITATSSPHYILKKDTLKKVLNRELLIIDLALPRDVEPGVEKIAGVELFGLEDLATIIEQNRQKKHQALKQAKGIIERECEGIWSRMQNYKEEFLRDPEVLLKK